MIYVKSITKKDSGQQWTSAADKQMVIIDVKLNHPNDDPTHVHDIDSREDVQ